MRRYRIGLVALLAALVACGVLLAHVSPDPSAELPQATVAAPDSRTPAPDFTGIVAWVNSGPLTLQALRGHVVLVDFWTFSCVNCVRTIPHLQQLDADYRARGLEIVGVHSPEFDFEKSPANVAAAVRRLGITWPVAVDSNMATWNAYGNEFWPAEYLLDQRGRLAYQHNGEGDYGATAAAVASLLAAPAMPAAPLGTPPGTATTPELYAGSERGSLDHEDYGSPGAVVRYPAGTPGDPDSILVSGPWADHGQYLQAAGDARVLLRFHAHDVYIVASTASEPLPVRVLLDGRPPSAAAAGPDAPGGMVTVSRSDLYHVIAAQDANTEHLVTLDVPAGFQLYTFTFG